MNRICFLKGMGLGLMVGTSVGAAMAMPKHCRGKRLVSRCIKVIGDVVDDIGDAVGR